VIGKHRYLTVNSGTTQPLSVLNTDGGIYYIDTRLGKLSVVGSEGKNELSVIKGMSTFFNKKFSNTNIIEEFNPLNDYIVSSVHDKKNNKLYFTIKNGPEDINPSTIIFNERL